MHKKNIALNTLQWLIWHKTKLNQTKPNHKGFIAAIKERNQTKSIFP